MSLPTLGEASCRQRHSLSEFDSLILIRLPAGSNYTGTKFNYCCIQPIDINNGTSITNDPSFIDLANGDFHLQSNSPCINSGNNSYVTRATDLGSLARVAGGTVDLGAYEYPTPSSIISYAWLLKNGLPIDGSVDALDLDGDGMNTWQEWLADTSPTNALSKLVVQSVGPASSGGGVTITWPSSLHRSYYLERSTNLSQAGSFSSIASNIFSASGTATFIYCAATNAGPYFYRVGVWAELSGPSPNAVIPHIKLHRQRMVLTSDGCRLSLLRSPSWLL